MSIAVAMYQTPLWLRLFGFPAWRVKVHVPNSEEYLWAYYKDIHDYTEKNS